MEQIIPILAEWLDSSLWTILGFCALTYLVLTIRFFIHWIATTWYVDHFSDWPMEIKVPRDVSIGMGLAIFVACASASFSLLLRDPTLPAEIVAIALDLLLLFCSVAPIAFPLRYYRIYRLEMKREMEKSGKLHEQEGKPK